MRIFLDTNFIIDWLFRDEFKSDCEHILKIGENNAHQFYVSFLSLANLAYLARKQPKELLYNNLSKICKLFEIVANTKSNITQAIEINNSDFEDAIQYATA